MKSLLIVLFAVVATACDSAEFVAARHPDRAAPSTIYIHDAFGECYALRDYGKGQEWVHMKPEACETTLERRASK